MKLQSLCLDSLISIMITAQWKSARLLNIHTTIEICYSLQSCWKYMSTRSTLNMYILMVNCFKKNGTFNICDNKNQIMLDLTDY